MEEKILEVGNLSVSLIGNSGNSILKDIYFRMDRGEVVGIVGETGSGKSMLVQSLLGLLPNDSIKIDKGSNAIFHSKYYGNVDLFRVSKEVLSDIRRRELGVIFSNPKEFLNPRLTCGELISESFYGSVSLDELKHNSFLLLSEVGFKKPESIYTKYPSQLSDGEAQQLAICLAINSKPSLIIADEPTSELDSLSQREIIDLLLRVRRISNASIIFISHNLALVSEVASRTLVMEKGKLVEDQLSANIFKGPKYHYTKKLIRSALKLSLSKKEKSKKNKENTPLRTYETSREVFLPKKRQESDPKSGLLLSVRGLKVNYDLLNSDESLSSIQLDLRLGESISLVGSSGSGKTTIAKTIAGVLKPIAGQIWYNGIDILSASKRIKRTFQKEVQLLYQDPSNSFSPFMTVEEIIKEPMTYYQIGDDDDERVEKAEELLELVQLNEAYLKKTIYQLTPTQLHQIALARALACEPKILILDEVASLIDVTMQVKLLTLINKIKEDFNLSIVFVSHDFAVIRTLARKILVVQNGHVVEEDFIENLLKNPKSQYTKDLLAAVPTF